MGGCLGSPEDDMGYPGDSEGPNSGDADAASRKQRKTDSFTRLETKGHLV